MAVYALAVLAAVIIVVAEYALRYTPLKSNERVQVAVQLVAGGLEAILWNSVRSPRFCANIARCNSQRLISFI